MHPFLMVMIAILLPIFFLLLMVGPLYIGMCASIYTYFNGVTLSEMPTYALDVNYVLGIHEGFYNQLFSGNDINWVGFVLPVYGPVLVGFLISVFATWYLIRYIRNIFVLM